MKAFFCKVTSGRNIRITAVYALLCGLFLLFCIDDKIVADASAGKWQSLLTRIALVGLVGSLVAWRIDVPEQFRIKRSPHNQRGMMVAVLFLAVLSYPLFSNPAYLSASVKEVIREITKKHESRTDQVLALLQTFPDIYERQVERTFNLPKAFIHFNALVKIYGLGVSPNKNVAYGKNGFYFEGWGARRVEKGVTENFDNIADYMGQIPFSQEELRQWKRALEERLFWLREQGIDYVFVLAPTKAMIYPENLPDNLQAVKKGLTRYDQLTDFLRNASKIPLIDLKPALLVAKKKRSYPLLFYKTDFHWNFYGAFIAYQAIIDQLRVMFPHYQFEHPEFSEFELSIDRKWAHHRFMDMVGLPVFLHKNEHYITLVPKPGGRYDSALDLPPEGISDVYPPERTLTADDGSSMKIRLILNPDAPVRSILLLGDSFFEKCVYFFSADAQRVLNYRTIVNFPDQILKYEKPDLVIQEILNMFILRPPPQNPDGFKTLYLTGKFFDESSQVLVRQDSTAFKKIARPAGRIWETALPKGSLPASGEVRIARVTVNGSGSCTPDIRLFDADDQEIDVPERDRHVTRHETYLEWPVVPVKHLVVSIPEAEGISCAPAGLEIRSDLPLSKK
jgi:hypothetical protein